MRPFGVIDEGISVVLIIVIDEIVAVHFKFIDGIEFVPLQKRAEMPEGLSGAGIRINQGAVRIVDDCHVEAGSGDIAFIVV